MALQQFMTGKADLRLKRGESLNRTFTFLAAGVPIDWTGTTFTGQIRDSNSLRSALLATIAVTGDNQGNLTLTGPDNVLECGSYVYDIFAVNGTTKFYPIEGVYSIEGSVTRG